MATEELADAVQQKLRFKNKIGYALGDVGNVLSWGVVGAYLQMFFSDVLRIPLKHISVLMLASRIWDAVNDPLWGAYTDRRPAGRQGKYRLWLLRLSLPLSLSTVLVFLKVPGLSPTGYLAWGAATYILYTMMYTGINIPFGSMASLMTRDPTERSQLSMSRAVGGALGGLPGQVLLPLFVYSTTAAGIKYLDGNKLTVAVAVLAALSCGVYLLSYRWTQERILPQVSAAKPNLLRTLKSLLRNEPFWALCLVGMLLQISQVYSATMFNYLFKDYFAAPALYSLASICSYAPQGLLLPVINPLVRRYGKKSVCAAGLALSALASVLLYALHTQSPAVFLAGLALAGLGTGALNLELWALVNDVLDDQQARTGRQENASCYALFIFTRKIGYTVAGAGVPLILLAIGYSTGQAVQASAVLPRMYAASTLLLGGIYFLMVAALALYRVRRPAVTA
ncbi:MAG: glycoside-pentoside-hexuronide (GPH):cation symporter [Oscillospiraceae bacterium]|jgi:GPH family glycoside/pentoside/hexuronide:cation symporter|nr:glycoside-pentoside-hexuronide (GPH):cation symporter [Oscillospiraceae bacterium]